MTQPCGCGGGSVGASAAAASGSGKFTVQLNNGTKVGSFPTRADAEQANRRYYSGAGTVVPR